MLFYYLLTLKIKTFIHKFLNFLQRIKRENYLLNFLNNFIKVIKILNLDSLILIVGQQKYLVDVAGS